MLRACLDPNRLRRRLPLAAVAWLTLFAAGSALLPSQAQPPASDRPAQPADRPAQPADRQGQPPDESAANAEADSAGADSAGQDSAQEDTPMHTNQLAGETSPYLLQHAHNPVDWYPWGEEAFQKARREDKPIFLSVGYSTCYWCHVMEKESFEDPEVAEVINRYFVAIKVDREERPDIDEQYMMATQLMTQRGGWPNSVWLTPDGKPWMAGTYFPKPRFIAVLKQIADFWENRRDDVNRQAAALVEATEQMAAPRFEASPELSETLLRQATQQLLDQFDPQHGGFGGPPKFPPHGTLALLLDRYRRTEAQRLLEPITQTLDAMWLGGMHDHLGGGFHRYSTDARWLLPHFEKMLYDNAQLMRVYAEAYALSGHPRYRAAVADIDRWLRREMTAPGGGFYSALDSGEVGAEGEAYVWSIDQLQTVLGEDDAALYADLYQCTPEGNFAEEATGERTGKNIPHLPRPLDAIAEQHPLGAEKLRERLSEIETKLLAHRLTWPQPHKDDKILASWNGLMIGALALSGELLDEPRYTQTATRAAEFVTDAMLEQGELLRSYREGEAKQPAYLDDYAYLSWGLLQLHRTSGEQRWLDQATAFAETLLTKFQDAENGGFYFTAVDHEDLIVRSKHLGGGGNLPSANGVAAQVLLELSRLTGETRYRTAAERTLESLAGFMAVQVHTSEHLLIALADQLELEEAKPEETQPPARADAVVKRVPPVTITATIPEQPLPPGQQATLSVELAIESGWHLYADNPDVDFAVPTRVSVSGDPAVVDVGPAAAPPAVESPDPVAEQTLRIYEGQIEFRIPLQIADAASPGAATLKVVVESQACDDERCLQPQKTTFQVPLRIAAER